jgi:hypothetical protein
LVSGKEISMLLSTVLVIAALPTVWIVDQANGPGTHFTDLPAAVAAAQSGDTILVRAGVYTTFSVSGKALTIRGAGTNVTRVEIANANPASPATAIDSVPAGESFFVGGITFQCYLPGGQPPAGPPSLAALSVSGVTSRVVLSNVAAFGSPINVVGGRGLAIGPGSEVHAYECVFWGGSSGHPIFSGPRGGSGVGVTNGIFAASRCTIKGGNGGGLYGSAANPNRGGSGVEVAGAVASLNRCFVEGGGGISISPPDGAAGGAGIEIPQPAFVRVSGVLGDTVIGGGCAVTANAGPAINADASATVFVHDFVWLFSGNQGGTVTTGPVVTGLPQMPTVSVSGAENAAGELDPDKPTTVTVEGFIPAAQFILALDTRSELSLPFAPWGLGEPLVPIPPAAYFIGSLDALGTWSTTGVAAAIPSLTGVPLRLQAGVWDPLSGQIRLSGGEVVLFRN